MDEKRSKANKNISSYYEGYSDIIFRNNILQVL